MKPTRINPATIAAVLAAADEHGVPTAARNFDFAHRTVYRWVVRREKLGGEWPTATDIEEWARDHGENAKRRRRTAALQRDYKKRRYLAGGGRMKIDSIGTVRRLRALYALGWTSVQISERLNVTPARVNHLASGLWLEVHRVTAQRVEAVYAELCMVRPVDTAPRSRGQIKVHDRQRKIAKGKGYLPPLAWDNIDDPAEKPRTRATRPLKTDIDPVVIQRVLAGDRMPTTRAEKLAITAAWEASGRTLKDLEHLMGWKSDRYTVREAS